MILTIGSQAELEAHGYFIVGGVDCALSDSVRCQVAHRSVDFQIPCFDLIFIHKDCSIVHSDLMVSVSRDSTEGNTRSEG